MSFVDIKGLSKYIDQIVSHTEFTDPVFSVSIKKWKIFLIRTTVGICKQLNIDYMDAFNDLMIPLSRLYANLDVIQYRYKGFVYDLEKDYGSVFLLKTNSFNKRKNHKRFLIRREHVELVKKAKLISQFFKKIQQEACVIIRKKYNQKNGYKVVGEYSGIAKIKGKDVYEKKNEVITKKVVKKTIKETSIDSPICDKAGESSTTILLDTIKDDNCIQDSIERMDILNKFKKNLSQEAFYVISAMCQDPEISDSKLKAEFNLSQRKLDTARAEIRSVANKIHGVKHKSVFDPYVIYDDHFYFYGKDLGDQLLIKTISSSKIVDKEDAWISEISYRSPVILKASDVL